MNTQHGKVEGDFEVLGPLTLHGMITGNTIVRAGGYLVLHGMLCKELTVEEGGRAIIHGMVGGSVRNVGGYVEIFGTVNGEVERHAGTTEIRPRARVGSIQY